MKFDKKQQAAYEVAKMGLSLLLLGAAGTGKSLLLKLIMDSLVGNYVVAAFSGVASELIGGVTLHSLFGFEVGYLEADYLPDLDDQQRKKIAAIDTLIIDEISLVRSDLFSAVDRLLRHCASGDDKNLPFGGTQIICSGDFYQLEPVSDDDDKARLYEDFGGVYCFLTEAWQQANFHCCQLTKIYRQRDKRFSQLLNRIRTGDMSPLTVGVMNVDPLEELNDLLAQNKEVPGSLWLCTTNRAAENHNSKVDAANLEPGHWFNAIIKGEFDTKRVPESIVLKVGSKVMTTVNKYNAEGKAEFVNGSRGRVVEITEKDVWVRIGNRTLKIVRHRWVEYEYRLTKARTGEEVLEKYEIGECLQFPLIRASAITCHKSQGLSLDAAHVHLGNKIFASGLLYVALSRVRCSTQLTINRPITYEDLMIDAEVEAFYESIQ